MMCTRNEYLGNKKAPAAPLPVGYVETVELERLATAQGNQALDHQSKGEALFQMNQLTNALLEFQWSLEQWKKTLAHYKNLEEHYRFNATLLQTHRHPLQDKEQEKHQTVQNDLRLTQLGVSYCRSKIGCVLYRQGDLQGALNEYLTAVSLQKDLKIPADTTFHSLEYLQSMIRSISNDLQREQQRPQLAPPQQKCHDALLLAASLRIQAGCALYEQGRLILAMKEFKRAAELCRQQPNSQEALQMLFMIGSFCSDKKEELVQHLLKVEGQASIDWPSSKSITPSLLGEKLPPQEESIQMMKRFPQAHLPTYDKTAMSILAEAAASRQESKERRPFHENEERPLKKCRKTKAPLDISKFKCSPGLLAAFKWEQERKAKEADASND